MRLDDIGEFRLIERLAAMLPATPDWVLAGIGDDCAALDGPGGKVTLFATDTSVEGTHFLMETPRIGWKTLVSNLSDIAAMGGTPRAALASLAARPDVELAVVDRIYHELARAAAHYDIPVVGGDTVSTAGPLVLSVSVLGEVRRERLVRRSGARVGDALMVVGWLGDALGGHEVYQARRAMWDMSHAVTTHQPALEYHDRLAHVTAALMRGSRPKPRLEDSRATHRLELAFHNPLALVRAGQVIAETGRATAMIDVSDGLHGDASKLADASNVGFRIEMGALPVSPDLVGCFGEDRAPWLALQGGEDYALLFTVPQDGVAEVTQALEAAHHLPSVIGVATDPADGVYVVDPSGEVQTSPVRSWGHFRPLEPPD